MYKLYNIFNKILSESLHSEAQFTTQYTLEKLKQLIINPDTNKPYTEDEFKKIHQGAYKSAKSQNLVNTLFPVSLTPEEVKKIALDPKTGKKRFCNSEEFKEKEPKAYKAAEKLGILTDLYFDAKDSKDYTSEDVKQCVIDCNTGKMYPSRTIFSKKCKKGYRAATRLGMLNQLYPTKGEYNKAFIYVFKFSDKQNNPTSAYVGLSTNPELRKKEHITGINRHSRPQITAVTEYINNHPEEKYEFEVLTKEPLEVSGETNEERYNSPAGKAEREQAEYFKNKGYKIINKKEGGKDFGNTPVESEEELLNQALKYKSWTDLMRAGMPPQYPNPNSWKSGLYQKIRRKDKTNPGFTKKVKQAIGTKRLQELAGIAEIKDIRTKES